MNDIFVNSTLANLPSYDLGGVVELDVSNFSIRGLMMSSKTGSQDKGGKNYNYYSLQLGYKFDTSVGKGNYRIYGFTTNKRFQNWNETDEESLQCFGISADQKLSEIFGLFARLGWQDDDTQIDRNAVYPGGLNINGKLWGRENDELGLGYAYLNG
jgi:porin